MTAARSDFIAELARDITREATDKKGDYSRGQAIKADLNTLAEQLVEALVNRRDEVVAKAYEAVERGYSEIVTSGGFDEQVFDAPTTAAELRGLTRLLGAAMQYRQAPKPMTDVVREAAYRPLLEALHTAPGGSSTGILAQKVGVEPATVARKLPYLRSIGLVRSQQVGKTMINRLTAEARKLVAELWAEEEAQAAPAAAEYNPGPRFNVGTLKNGMIMGLADQFVAKRAARVYGKKLKIDAPVGLNKFDPGFVPGNAFVIEHGKVSSKTATTVEVRAAGDMSKDQAQSVAGVILAEGTFLDLCKIKAQIPDNLAIHFRGDRIVASVGASADDSMVLFSDHTPF